MKYIRLYVVIKCGGPSAICRYITNIRFVAICKPDLKVTFNKNLVNDLIDPVTLQLNSNYKKATVPLKVIVFFNLFICC